MFEFKIFKKAKNSRARIGVLKTEHGIVETPCLAPVATQATVKALTNEETENVGSQILIVNTLYLHLSPGEKIVAKAGGLHEFMNWKNPLMTDSGGFQVFSWGFGKDFGIGKILKAKNKKSLTFFLEGKKVRDKKINPAPFGGILDSAERCGINNSQLQNVSASIERGQQPRLLKITDEGVFFTSFLDGKKLFLGPRESIKIQEKLGADIIFAFDECPPPLADYKYMKNSILKTHNWAKVCLETKKTKQALFGIVQGGRYKDLRQESAKFIGSLPFDGFGIGGEFGADKNKMSEMLEQVVKELPEQKPRHLLGIGYLEDIPKIIKAGIDIFDCNVPTHYARRGIAFVHAQGRNSGHNFISFEKLNLKQAKFLKDKSSLDKKCFCFVCQNFKKNYISHLFRAKEITGLRLLTFHNLYFFNKYIEEVKRKIMG
ncbi:tRNA guanosine(34) transglycosylase Tgt [Patescibacteria group bacterium]|nr:tRNA guanosine(34) transglycosylase Tgt [Patescibacteria group bacterium]